MFKQSLQRNIFRLFCALILILILILCIGYFFPLPAFIVKPIISKVVRKSIPDLQLSYAQARVILFRRQATLKGVSFTDPSTTGSLEARLVALELQYFPLSIKTITVENPSFMSIKIPIKKGEKLASENPLIGCLLAKRLEREGKLPLLKINIKGGRTELFCAPAQRERKNLRFENLNAQIQLQAEKIFITGATKMRIFDGQEASLIFRTVYEINKNKWTARIKTPAILIPVIEDEKPVMSLVKNGELNFEIAGTNSARNVSIKFDARQISIIPTLRPHTANDIFDIQLLAEMSISEREKNAVDIKKLVYRDRDLNITASGNISPEPEEGYFNFQFEAKSRSEGWFARILQALDLPEKIRIKINSETSLSINGAVSGLIAPPLINNFTLTGIVKSLEIILPEIRKINLPLPAINLKNNSASLEKISLRSEFGKIALTGKLIKTPAAKVLEMEYQTSAALSVAPLQVTIAPPPSTGKNLQPILTEVKYGGKVNTSVKGKMNLDLSKGAKVKELDFLAKAQLENIETSPSCYIEPFLLSGIVTAEEKSLVIDELKTEIENFPLHITGKIYNPEYFWEDPSWEFSIAGKTPGTHLIEKLRRYTKEDFISSEEGEFSYNIIIRREKTSADPPTDSAMITTNIDKLSLNFPKRGVEIKNWQSKMKFVDSRCILESATAEINSIPLSLTGDISAQRINLTSTSKIDLARLRQEFIKLLEPMIMDGNVDLVLNIQFQNPIKPTTTKNRPQELFEEYRFLFTSFFSRLKEPRFYPGIVNGEIRLNQNTFYYCDFPSPINNISGTISIRGNRLEFQNVVADCGNSTASLHSGHIYLKDNIPIMEINTKLKDFYLLDWTSGWHTHPPRRPLFVKPASDGLLFYVTIKAEGERVIIPPYSGEEFKTRFEFYNYQGEKPNLVRFTETQGKFYGGIIYLDEGKIEILQGETSHSWAARAENIILEKFALAVKKNEEKIQGDFSGAVKLRGSSSDISTLRGEGEFFIKKSRFIKTPLFLELGKITAMPYFADASFTNVNGKFIIADKKIEFSDTILENPMMRLGAKGTVGFDESLDGELYLAVFSGVAERIPVIGRITGEIFKYVEEYGVYVGKFNVTGSLDKPTIYPVLLFADEIIKDVKKIPLFLKDIILPQTRDKK